MDETEKDANRAAASRRKIRLDFSDFYHGFNKTNNFFYNLLVKRFDVEICDQPDFLIYSNRERHVHRLQVCTKIYFAVECYEPDFSECDYAFTCRYLDDPRHFRLPFYVLYGDPRRLLKDNDDLDRIFAAKSKFCSFVVSSQHPRKNRNRSDFFLKLSKYKRVDSGGRFMNNIGGPIQGSSNGKVEFLKPYKFNIAFENQKIPGYTTEKIFEAMLARTMPIYWGSPRIHEEFNPKSFLNFYDYGSDEALIERVIQLDQDDSLYRQYLAEPYFNDNVPNPYFDRERILDQFEMIFSRPIRPVSLRRRWYQIGRWIAAKKGKPIERGVSGGFLPNG